MCQNSPVCQKSVIFGTSTLRTYPLAERGVRIKAKLFSLCPSPIKSSFGNADLFRDRFDRDAHKTLMLHTAESDIIFRYDGRTSPFVGWSLWIETLKGVITGSAVTGRNAFFRNKPGFIFRCKRQAFFYIVR